MSHFSLHNQSVLPRDVLFQISTDISNFHKVMPRHFKSLEILDDAPCEKLALESIMFLGLCHHVKTKHVIVHPNTHHVFIMSGLLKGTVFSEKYTPSCSGTDIEIVIRLRLNGILKFIPFSQSLIIKKMNSVMREFVICSENYANRICEDN